jgi:dUTP pyrophosphatase
MEAIVELKVLNEKAVVPEYHWGSAGFDLCSCSAEPVIIGKNECVEIPTGIAIYLKDPNYCAYIYPRSGLGTAGLILMNSVGVIDSDYQGEIKVFLKNVTTRRGVAGRMVIYPGDRFAQVVIAPVIHASFKVVDKFSETTARGVKGIGSTGKEAHKEQHKLHQQRVNVQFNKELAARRERRPLIPDHHVDC